MIRKNKVQSSSQSLLDQIIWFAFLALLVVISFVNEVFSSKSWLLIACAVYFLSALTAVNIFVGGRCNWLALNKSKPALLVLLLMVLLLVAQIYVSLPSNTDWLLKIDRSQFTPDWYAPMAKWSVVPEKTRWLLASELMIFFGFCLSIALLSTRRRLKQLLFVLMLVGLFHALIAMMAKFGSLHLVDTKQLDGHFDAARAWFVNRNHFAAFMSLCMTGAMTFQIKQVLDQPKLSPSQVLLKQLSSVHLIYFSALIIAIVAIVLSQSRAAFAGLVLSIVVMLLLVGKYVFKRTSSSRLTFLIPILIVVCCSLIYFGADLIERFGSDSYLGERLAQWKLTWVAIDHSPFIGFGGNSYADVFQILRGDNEFRQVVYNQAHNDYLHIWLEQGALGLILWLALLFLVLRSSYLVLQTTRSRLVSATMLAVLISVSCALIQSMVDFNLQIINIRFYFFVIMSLAFSVPMIKHRTG